MDYNRIITPFTGDKYTLELQGDSIPPSEFKALTDRIASARVGRVISVNRISHRKRVSFQSEADPFFS